MAIAFKASTSACTAQQLRGHSTRDQCQYGFTHLNEPRSRKGSAALHVRATSGKLDLDFSDPSWRQKYQEDWDSRFNLPHITDIFDLKPRLTTFSLKKNRFLPLLRVYNCFVFWKYKAVSISLVLLWAYVNDRTPLGDTDDSSPDMWNGYVNKDDRALLKVSIENIWCEIIVFSGFVN
jgi:6-phosphofructokinase 1